jgi:hypothetical protein
MVAREFFRPTNNCYCTSFYILLKAVEGKIFIQTLRKRARYEIIIKVALGLLKIGNYHQIIFI